MLTWPVGFRGFDARITLRPCVRMSFWFKAKYKNKLSNIIKHVPDLGLLNIKGVFCLSSSETAGSAHIEKIVTLGSNLIRFFKPSFQKGEDNLRCRNRNEPPECTQDLVVCGVIWNLVTLVRRVLDGRKEELEVTSKGINLPCRHHQLQRLF